MHPWSIKTKSILVSTLTGIFSVVILILVINSIFTAELKKLELADLTSNIKQVDATYEYALSLYEKKVIDWGEWDDTYQFIVDLNKQYIKSNLVQATIANLSTDELLYYDNTGELKYSLISEKIAAKEPDFPEDMRNLFKKDPKLFTDIITQKKASGLVKTDNGILMYAGHPILHSDGTGPARGVVVFGRYVDTWLTDQLSNITQIQVELDTTNQEVISNNLIISHVSIAIDNDNSKLYLKIITPRNVWLEGQKVLVVLLLATSLITVLSIGINYFVLQQTVLVDLQKFKAEVGLIASNSGSGMVQKQGVTKDMDDLRNDVNYLINILNTSKSSLQEKAEEVDKLNKLMTGREIKMTELKAIIADLKKKII